MSSRWSELESTRFNLHTYRFEADTVSEPLLSAIKESNVDLVVLRVPVSELKNVHLLRALGGHPLVADTLVYYTYDCSQAVPSPASNHRVETGCRLGLRFCAHRFQYPPWLASTAALDRVLFVWGTLPPRRRGQPLHLIYPHHDHERPYPRVLGEPSQATQRLT